MTDSVDPPDNFLAWFLGPKAEHGQLFEKLVVTAVRDYIHWRRNYFPADSTLITRDLQRAFESEQDLLYQKLWDLLNRLRRNFPFYSPRYLAHQLSDVAMPATIGYLAGLLYNPNNVTTEAAPETVDLELDACNHILRMLGYTLPPAVPPQGTNVDKYYSDHARDEFGWAHITAGGTTANVEALWLARNIRYFPLAVRDAATAAKLEVFIKLPTGVEADVRSCKPLDLLWLKPNECIYLLDHWVDALRRRGGYKSMEDLSRNAWSLLDKSKYSIRAGLATAMAEFRPLIFTSEAAHYSVAKAADILGLGSRNVVAIETTGAFEISADALRQHLTNAYKQRRACVAVVGMVGTTEEGAVDPIHRLVDLRDELEQQGLSFWLHVDGAWGGYLRCLLHLSPAERLATIRAKLKSTYGIPSAKSLAKWHEGFSRHVKKLVRLSGVKKGKSIDLPEPRATALRRELQQLSTDVGEQRLAMYTERLLAFLSRLRDDLPGGYRHSDFDLNSTQQLRLLEKYTSESVTFRDRLAEKQVTLNWSSRETFSALLAMSKADSITIDPHKLGYAPYPCGVIAYRNDRGRRFVQQDAPYLTGVKADLTVHRPPRRAEPGKDGKLVTVTDTFGQYTLEGSRPGAAAAGLWLMTELVPLHRRGHGQILKESLLAALELYHWLISWEKMQAANVEGSDYRFVPLSESPPATNIVCFTVKKNSSMLLKDMNDLSSGVYRKFSISSELGQREYSYSQAFFVSRTEMNVAKGYQFKTLRGFFDRCKLGNTAGGQYKTEGLVVLRATVMNPYVRVSRRRGSGDFLREFVTELGKAAAAQAKMIG